MALSLRLSRGLRPLRTLRRICATRSFTLDRLPLIPKHALTFMYTSNLSRATASSPVHTVDQAMNLPVTRTTPNLTFLVGCKLLYFGSFRLWSCKKNLTLWAIASAYSGRLFESSAVVSSYLLMLEKCESQHNRLQHLARIQYPCYQNCLRSTQSKVLGPSRFGATITADAPSSIFLGFCLPLRSSHQSKDRNPSATR